MTENDLEFQLADTEPQFLDQRAARPESAAPFGVDAAACTSLSRGGPVEATRLFVSLAQMAIEELVSPGSDFDAQWVDAGRFLDAAHYWLRVALEKKAAEAKRQPPVGSWFDSRAVRVGANDGLRHCALALEECRFALLTLHRQRREHASLLVAALVELCGALSGELGN